MTIELMKSKLSVMTGETDDAVLLTYLELAADKVTRKCYPFQPENTTVPACYQTVQLEVAAYLINKRGAEGETAHNENGINRSYESASVPDSMLKGVIPFAAAFPFGEN